MTLFTVDQRQFAIKFQLGEVRASHHRTRPAFQDAADQNVRYFDSRVLTFATVEPERFITSEKKNVLVDLFVKGASWT